MVVFSPDWFSLPFFFKTQKSSTIIPSTVVHLCTKLLFLGGEENIDFQASSDVCVLFFANWWCAAKPAAEATKALRAEEKAGRAGFYGYVALLFSGTTKGPFTTLRETYNYLLLVYLPLWNLKMCMWGIPFNPFHVPLRYVIMKESV